MTIVDVGSVRRVVEFHGGTVSLESEEGKGVTFYAILSKR